MAFKRFFNQFTNNLDRRFNTELNLAPDSMSTDVQLIADIEREIDVSVPLFQEGSGLVLTILTSAQIKSLISDYSLDDAFNSHDYVYAIIDNAQYKAVEVLSGAWTLLSMRYNIEWDAVAFPPLDAPASSNVNQGAIFWWIPGATSGVKLATQQQDFIIPLKITTPSLGAVLLPIETLGVYIEGRTSDAGSFVSQYYGNLKLVFRNNRTRSK